VEKEERRMMAITDNLTLSIKVLADGFHRAANVVRQTVSELDAFHSLMPLSGFAGIVTQYRNEGVKWSVARKRGWHFHFWTPAWHQGRGPYLSLGLGWFAVYRGY
jgi:hypothetical protein